MDLSQFSKEELARHIELMNAEMLELRDALRDAKDQSAWMDGAMKTRTRLLSECAPRSRARAP